jgi:hypothetical protein
MIIKPGCQMTENTYYGQTCCPSRCSQRLDGFMFGEWPTKPIILNACQYVDILGN